MNKENVLFGIIGLLVGLIVGFLFTNYLNRSAYEQMAAAQSSLNPAAQAAQQLPNQPNQLVKEQAPGGMMPAVQETIEKANREPNNFEAQMAAAEMYYRIQRFDDAAKFYERANQLKPDDYETVIKLGNVYFDGGKFEQAEKWYSQALAKNPADVNVRTDLGLTFFLRQPPDIERAVQEYRKSLAVNPNHELTLQNLSVALQQKGDSAGLQETIAQLEKVNPNNPAVARFKQQ